MNEPNKNISERKSIIVDLVQNHPVFVLISFISALFTISGLSITSIYFTAQKRPFYSVKSFNLINDSTSTIDNLSIRYSICDEKNDNCTSKTIPSLTVSKILFWNGGRRIIEDIDLKRKPIEILSRNGNQILEAKEFYAHRKDITGFRVNKEKNYIFFDAFESRDCAVITVAHTGLSSEDIEIRGYVYDSGIKRDDNLPNNIRKEYINRYESFGILDKYRIYILYTMLMVFAFFVIYLVFKGIQFFKFGIEKFSKYDVFPFIALLFFLFYIDSREIPGFFNINEHFNLKLSSECHKQFDTEII